MTIVTESVEHGEYLFYNNLRRNWQKCHSFAKTFGSFGLSYFCEEMGIFSQDAQDVTAYFKWAVHQYIDRTGVALPESNALKKVFNAALNGHVMFTERGIENMNDLAYEGESILREMRKKTPFLLLDAISQTSAILNDPNQVDLGVAIYKFIYSLRPYNEGRNALIVYVSRRIFMGINDAPGFCWEFYRHLYSYKDKWNKWDVIVLNNLEAMLKELTK